MTVVPDDQRMTLICDTCGDTDTGTACVLPDAEVVWTLLAEYGWSGSPFATGPHRCPRCSPLPPGTRPRRADRDTTLGVDLPGVVAADLDDGDALRCALRDAVEVGAYVVVDLSGVRTVDSDGLGLLVRAQRDARERGRALCLAAPSRFVRAVLHTMRLTGAFPLFDSPAAALARLSPAPAGPLPAVPCAHT
ncbi:STAS domain-containing protein [Micromonospora olivasterospora]|uniref:Anti-anti-sigma factor n=1 Tax=Micromonospora olivasterospora TaxID=1880 RepID=A0A562IFU3_MICOL|nr:STAS domain-containing protein [Micromonospora olivasterospora]TWH69891.1 anti-anti-sigma factor [Micromonospora olivasterospora]